ncbi:MAG TPA: SDR family NAD(P)-dependent oxidoreductase [Alphaproteobacteria bacterium]|nr:SDR family NAD(P)-dependent oxidoreductase [Alphaproteobacteria bacterium]
MAHGGSFKSILITGASSGLGGALARAYAKPGVTLGLIGRTQEKLDKVTEACRALGAEVRAAAIDVADAEALGAWILDFENAAPVDLVIANAGTSGGPAPGTAFEGLTLATRQVRTNLLGVMNTVEPLLPAFLSRGKGQVAIVSSVASYRGLPYSPGYSASKAGARAYGEAIRAMLSPRGIPVTVICPGFFDSPMTDRWKGPTPFLFTLERTAAIVKRGIDKGRSRVAFPSLLVLGLRLADLLPAPIGDAIMRANRFHIVSG